MPSWQRIGTSGNGSPGCHSRHAEGASKRGERGIGEPGVASSCAATRRASRARAQRGPARARTARATARISASAARCLAGAQRSRRRSPPHAPRLRVIVAVRRVDHDRVARRKRIHREHPARRDDVAAVAEPHRSVVEVAPHTTCDVARAAGEMRNGPSTAASLRARALDRGAAHPRGLVGVA